MKPSQRKDSFGIVLADVCKQVRLGLLDDPEVYSDRVCNPRGRKRLCVPVWKQDIIFKINNRENAPKLINVHRFKFISKYINAFLYVYSSVVPLLVTVTMNLNLVTQKRL